MLVHRQRVLLSSSHSKNAMRLKLQHLPVWAQPLWGVQQDSNLWDQCSGALLRASNSSGS